MPRFEITRNEDGEVVFAGRVTDASAFHDQLLWIRSAGHEAMGTYKVQGKLVTFDEAMTAATQAMDAAYAKKCETHKQITYYDGVCGPLASNTKRTAWVRK